MKRLLILSICLSIFGIANLSNAQQGALPDPVLETTDDSLNQTDTGSSGSTGFDSTMAQANQAFMALSQRQFPMARQQYEAAASSNREYEKMVDFCQNIMDRLREIYAEQIEVFSKMMSPDFRSEYLTRDEIDKMLELQIRQQQAGPSMGELGLISEIPISDLGLIYEGSDQMTLAEYVGWTRPRSANARIWHRARKRAIERSVMYALQEIKQQQRQERYQRMEEYRRRRLDRQGQGGIGVGGSMGGGMDMSMMGGGMGGGMGMGGGFGGGFGGGGMAF
jgi:hypothetical protein